MKNSNLAAAKRAKKDEFYTCREDIENELRHYESQFRGKIVYCNCDDPDTSEFWKFFQRNFNAWGLKRLIATHYEPDAVNYSYMIEMNPGDAWDGTPVRKPIQSNGDFRSAACIELLEQADIVVTNPPFSLFREYVAQLMEYGKKFLIIGNINAVTYKEFFPLIKNNQVWIGPSIHSGDRKFYVPDDYPLEAAGCGIDSDGRRFIRVKGVRWFTNLDYKKRHEPLDLRGVYYDPDKYPRYDNYDAIEVSKTADIPCDYDGIMGVPITFLDKYCPEQFEIIGMGCGWNGDSELVLKTYSKKQKQYDKNGTVRDVGKLNDGTPLIEIPRLSDKMTCYEADGHYYIRTYGRILIHRK